MTRELLIESSPELIRAAVIEDGKLCEIHRERVQKKKLTDSLFWGRVEAIRPSVGAAFINIGESLNAFLPLREGVLLRNGDFLIVQGTAVQAVETKGLRVSDILNLAGKWLVLVPGGQGVRLSKKIKDPQLREALQHAMAPLCPAGCGLIVRTASEDVTESALAEEVLELERRWLGIQKKTRGMMRPGVLYEPLDISRRLIRDIGSTLKRVIVNDPEYLKRYEQDRLRGWLAQDVKIEYFDERCQLMSDVFSLDAQVDKALKKRVWLDCGGYLVFDACEALTVIDVNSGKMTLGRDAEDTALRVNLEAAREVARQLRMRDIGGIVVVDYIDMRSEAHKEQLLQVIREESLRDRSTVTVGGMTRFGLIEMTRKRTGEQLDKALQTGCKVCGGSGRFLSAEETAFRALRQVRRLIIAGQRGPFLVRCTAYAAAALAEMTSPEPAYEIAVLPESGKHAEWFEIHQFDMSGSLPRGAVQMKKGKS